MNEPLCYPKIEVVALRCEGLTSASQIETLNPRFSWKLSDIGATRGRMQKAFEINLWEVDSSGNEMGYSFSSSTVNSSKSQWVLLEGLSIKSRSLYAWKVKIWDEQGLESDWSEVHTFGTGLCGEKWFTPWIGDGRHLRTFETAPARHFRRSFMLEAMPVQARLYLSAMGFVEPWINGSKVTEDLFIPGWPDFRTRVFYCAYDVTHLLELGTNILGIILGDGYYSGTMIPGHQYGVEARFSGFLELIDSARNKTLISTDDSWKWTDQGPILMNSIYDGETYDASKELRGWCDSNVSDDSGTAWKDVVVSQGLHGDMMHMASTGRIAEPVRRQETILPVSLKKIGDQKFLYDFGQNFAGWIRLKIMAAPGTNIVMRFSEIMENSDTIHTENLRSAKATATYIAKGGEWEEWEPRFTYFGFRYVEIAGLTNPDDATVTGIAVYANLEETGYFECSDELLNQLWNNTMWGQKSNFLEIPTDCPQRDERVGWTGDAQVFAPTALHNMNCGNYFRHWLYAVRDGLRDDPLNGGIPDMAPHTGFFHGSAGWAEAVVIVPWIVWKNTADKKVLEENFPAILHVLELMANESPNGIRKSKASYGDWLSPGYERDHYPPRYELIATAYYAYAVDLASRIAEVLGKSGLASHYKNVFKKIKNAFRKAYVDRDGRIVDDFQTSYLLAIAFDLLTPVERDKAAVHLVRKFNEKDNHLATGFLGTPLINSVLSSIGETALAYDVLQQKSYPGWLFSVINGATTIWERWDSWTPENGFHKDGMNSFNHYAYGSVVKWFYDTIAGLNLLDESPGWKHFRIEPQPGGGLTYAKATLNTPYGIAVSSWKISGQALQLNLQIPVNTTAEVILPTQDAEAVEIEDVPLSRSKYGSSIVTNIHGKVGFELGSGCYEISVKGYEPV